MNTPTSGASSASVPSKRPRTVLAGPYGHPFHPILVTVPIGAWVISLIFDIAAKVTDGDPARWADTSFWLLVIGIIGAVLAALFGFMDLLTIPSRTRAAGTAIAHMSLNTVALVIFAIDALIRSQQGHSAPGDDVSGLALGLTILGLLVVGSSGWLGGKLSYEYGVRVAREGDQAEAYAIPNATSGPTRPQR